MRGVPMKANCQIITVSFKTAAIIPRKHNKKSIRTLSLPLVIDFAFGTALFPPSIGERKKIFENI